MGHYAAVLGGSRGILYCDCDTLNGGDSDQESGGKGRQSATYFSHRLSIAAQYAQILYRSPLAIFTIVIVGRIIFNYATFY